MVRPWRALPVAVGLLLLTDGAAAAATARSGPMQRAMDKMAAANAEQLARREERDLVGVRSGGVKPLTRSNPAGLERTADQLGGYMARQGCISVSGVITPSTAASVRAFIEAEGVRAREEVEAGSVPFEARFGGVNCRGPGRYGTRQDLFLPVRAPPVRAALAEALRSLKPLLSATVGMGGTVHEVSSLVADPGAPRQCMHADTIVLPCPQYPDASMAPLYTFFVALQDVEDDMGHTVFLPTTHTAEAHLLWNSGQKQKESFISIHRAVQSALKTGDCAVFDSRIIHCGRANTSDKRRILFYFTLSEQRDWPLPDGLHGSNSIRAEDRGQWTVEALLAEAAER